MKQSLFLFFLISLPLTGFTQELNGIELLDKAIAYHDPQNQWKSFNGSFLITMQSPNRPLRKSKITLDLPKSYFRLAVERDGISTSYLLEGNNCSLSLNGRKDFSPEEAKANQLNCERATLMKDYYTYLYGLPMKLRDPGTRLHPVVLNKKFKGKEYLVLKVTYDKEVGEDSWYFYFDPETYAMEVYQFFHNESLNDGEYILLSGEETIQGIRMPKVRAWYYNKDNTYLGTDTLIPE
ncbi:DUF6503 family protein [Lentiprolixibacter aurantiacus]|uniref:DUF6503 family protein n=1 Tax=Lentiprolixibacter aurantiacus TaxID=2993939 RepID=A0AAE3MJN8_9FLAO|nr:DUF6503 family protein [Lentiprolixibacter aurantiacus]MCX2718713.1 DUF6503 family protein [Lentiprolixibacter aurantiacus]